MATTAPSSQALYTDGGVIKANPSPLAGTWAWCLVEDDRLVRSASGVILPAECDDQPVSNNVSELMAAVEALIAVPGDWRGTLYSDSQITLGRLFLDWPLKGVPVALAWRTKQVRERLRRFARVGHVLVQGHPTKADLECGVGKKRGLPASRWNVLADKLCTDEGARYLQVARYLNQTAEVGA